MVLPNYISKIVFSYFLSLIFRYITDTMRRRDFFSTLGATSLLSVASGVPAFASQSADLPVIKPSRLKPGDTIGLVTPATFITETQLREAIAAYEKLGFNVRYSPNMLVRRGYLAGTDQQRADDLNAMFADPRINGIICGRGGYGSARILPYLDFDVIRNNPKVFVGFSDITALLYGIFGKTGLVCFHGPMGGSDYNDYTVANFEKVLMQPELPENGQLRNDTKSDPDPNTLAEYLTETDKIIPDEVLAISPGTTEGPLIGGNLSLMAALNGTAYDLNFKDKLVFIEDVGEAPYRIDRMLTQLLLTPGKLKDAAGIILGRFNDCEAEDFDRSLSLYETLHDRLSGLGIPVMYGLSFGHIDKNLTLPFGIRTRMDTATQSLTLLEAAVL